jgi:3-oxoadipate enol-lactonase
VDGPEPAIPPGRAVDLPGRGRTWVYDSQLGGDEHPTPIHQSPLLLLHGWTSTAALNWCCCLTPLAADWRVLALDQRGHGRGVRSRRAFRLEDCADDAAALIEQLGTGPVVAVGYSMGGPVAQLLWQRHRHLVNGLVLCATAARFAFATELRGPARTIGLGMAMALSGVPANLRRQGYGLVVRSRVGSGVAPWALGEWQRHDPAALLQAGLALRRFDATGWIGSVDVPTAVVVTTRDVTVLPERQWQLAQSIPGSTAFPIAGTHRACVDQAELFVPALRAACRVAQRTHVPQPLST